MSFTWSYSSLSAYETCPRQFYEIKIAKNWKQEESEQIKWGNEVHKALEEKHKGKPLPERMKQFEEIVQPFFEAPGKAYAELKLAITVDHQPCDFFSKDAWARGIVDRLIINGHKALNVDWKTGKKKDNSKQLQMSTGLVLANYPHLAKVTTAFVWLAEPKGKRTTQETFTENDYSRIWAQFDTPLAEMQWSYQNNAWPARPSGLCKKHCPVLTCEHNWLGKKR